MDICFVSGASSNHFKSLKNLIESVLKFYPNNEFHVYDLGLTDDESAQIKNYKVVFEKFDYSQYPSYFDIHNGQAGAYAWKPVIISKVANMTNKPILWLDAGDVVVADLDPVFKAIRINGYFTPCSCCNIAAYCLPETLKYIDIPSDYLKFPMIAAAIVGLDINHPLGKKVLEEWVRLSMIEECILPENSTRQNNRWDQTILSCVLAKHTGYNYYVPNWWGFETIKIHQDVD